MHIKVNQPLTYIKQSWPINHVNKLINKSLSIRISLSVFESTSQQHRVSQLINQSIFAIFNDSGLAWQGHLKVGMLVVSGLGDEQKICQQLITTHQHFHHILTFKAVLPDQTSGIRHSCCRRWLSQNSLANVVLKRVVVLLNQVDGGQNWIQIRQSVANTGIHSFNVSKAWQRLVGCDQPFSQTSHHYWLACKTKVSTLWTEIQASFSISSWMAIMSTLKILTWHLCCSSLYLVVVFHGLD